MKTSRLALVAILSVGFGVALTSIVSRGAYAQETARASAAPAALARDSRTARVATALKAANLSIAKLTTGASIRLTAAAPRHPSGAAVMSAYAVNVDYNPADGAYIGIPVGTAPDSEKSMTVYMKFPTTPGSLYVVDCAVLKSPMAGSKVSFRLGAGGYNPYPVQDGHVLYAFSSTEAQSFVHINLTGISIVDHPQVFSCELAKVD